ARDPRTAGAGRPAVPRHHRHDDRHPGRGGRRGGGGVGGLRGDPPVPGGRGLGPRRAAGRCRPDRGAGHGVHRRLARPGPRRRVRRGRRAHRPLPRGAQRVPGVGQPGPAVHRGRRHHPGRVGLRGAEAVDDRPGARDGHALRAEDLQARRRRVRRARARPPPADHPL
ncbi:MAG: hypothetical protein AVDCRST_MAG66-94, partial [uncultured Pseudonocardia sp.]